MSGTYLLWLADAFRAAGLTVVEYDGWQDRAKSSGGYADGSRPYGCMWHHTASDTSPENDASYMCYGADAAPIANVLLARDGTVWLLAAGPTNTNGEGSGVTWSKGSVPADSMNSYAFGMEIANDGAGEPYPQAQIDAAFAVSNAVNFHCGNFPTDVCTHQVWAPTRKVDPATAAAVQGPWQPGSCTSAGTWDLADIKAECSFLAATPSPPSGDDMALLYVEVTDAWARFVATGQVDPLVLWQVGYTSGSRAQVQSDNLPHVQVSKAQLTGCTLIGRDPPPADDGGGPARWNPDTDFYEWVK